MSEPAPPRSRPWWSPARHQGLIVTVVLVAVVVGLAVGGAFGHTGPAVSAPPDATKPGAIRGVTKTAVRIVFYQPPEDDPVSKIVAKFVAPADNNARQVATVKGFIKAMGKSNPALRNRHIDLVVYTGSANLLDSVAARADAVKIAEEIKPYMVWNGPLLGTAFADELASRGVMCVMCVNGGTNAFFAAHAPYVWSLETTPEQVGAHAGEYVRKRLAGHPAQFAGDETMRHTKRRFGLLSVSGPFGGEGLGPSIEAELHKRGVKLADNMSYGDANAVNQVQATMIGRLKARGVTTVIYAGDPIAMGEFMHEATAQHWFPEWVMTGGFSSERSSWGRGDDPAQMKHAFGITPLPAPSGPHSDPVLNIYRGGNDGEDPPARQSVQALFAPVYIFFTALGAANGDLTPARVRKGMFDAKPIGGDPASPSIPMISFGNHGLWPYTDYAGLDDFSEIWWNPNARGADEFGRIGRGMWEFADGGRRYLPAKWTTGPSHAFVKQGAVTVIGN